MEYGFILRLRDEIGIWIHTLFTWWNWNMESYFVYVHKMEYGVNDKTLHLLILFCIFAWNTHLKGHMDSVHEGFTWKRNSNVHVTTVHEGVKPFKVDICGATFTRISKMKRHKAAIHEESLLIVRVVLLKSHCSMKAPFFRYMPEWS